jgi:uncharacterized protein (DUF924 family)
MSDPIEVLEFWLHEVGPDGWYAGGDKIDSICRERFADLWQAAHDGGLEHWVDGTVGTLAYLILTDQIPRNIHRVPHWPLPPTRRRWLRRRKRWQRAGT